MVSKGNVCFVQIGGEARFRPCIIINHIPESSNILIVPIPSSISAINHAISTKSKNKIMLNPNNNNGLRKISIADCSSVKTIQSNRVNRVVGQLTQDEYSSIEQVIKSYFE